MAVINHQARVVYVIVPKVACTSVKTLFRQLEAGGETAPSNGRMSRLLRLGRRAAPEKIHHVDGYRTTKFTQIGPVPDQYAKVALIRDPLQRLHSAWTNKVCRRAFRHQHEGVRDVVDNELELDPSFGYFIDHYDLYRAISRPARIHTERLNWHLGDDLSWYDRIFRMEELPQFIDMISERVGRKVALPERNVSPEEARPLGLEPRHAERLREILAPDYALLADIYDFDRSLAAFGKRHGVKF